MASPMILSLKEVKTNLSRTLLGNRKEGNTFQFTLQNLLRWYTNIKQRQHTHTQKWKLQTNILMNTDINPQQNE